MILSHEYLSFTPDARGFQAVFEVDGQPTARAVIGWSVFCLDDGQHHVELQAWVLDDFPPYPMLCADIRGYLGLEDPDLDVASDPTWRDVARAAKERREGLVAKR